MLRSRLVKNLLIIGLALGIYLGGYAAGHGNLVFEQGWQPKITSTELKKPREIDFSLFWEVWDLVRTKYAGELDNQQMVYDAINGALRSLDDPYTLFLPPDEAKRFNDDLKGSFEGIGAEIEKRSGLITIVAPLTDSPAAKAGVKAQDIIIKIDEAETVDMSLEEAISKIRGPKGSIVTLTVARESVNQPVEIKITRNTIVVKSVEAEIKADSIGYIKINQFGEDTAELAIKAIDELVGKKATGVIVDLRNNPGGFLAASIDVSSLFLKDRGAIVKEQNKAGDITKHQATLESKLTDLPMVVLVNGGSASASEIFAGAMQDYGRAKVIGEKTYGKGSVQELEPVSGGGAVRVTIAKWLTPKDRQINKLGISPDIEVKLTDEDTEAKRDPQLDKAIEELKQL